MIDRATAELIFSPWVLAVVGLAIGSFLNVVIHRLPRMLERQWWLDVAAQLRDEESYRRNFSTALPPPLREAGEQLARSVEALAPLSLNRPASRCPACAHPIRWHENVPLLGWLRLRGRCSACGVRISVRYPAIELATGLLFATVSWRIGPEPAALLFCALAAALLALALIDWDTTVLPDAITLPLMWAGLLAAALGWLPGVTLPDSLWGALAGYLSLWSVYWIFKLATGKEGMGYGDFKLLAALGAWLTWQALLPILLMASVLGAAVGIGMKFSGQLREGRYVPFGPFLAGGGIVVMLVGLPSVLSWMGWS